MRKNNKLITSIMLIAILLVICSTTIFAKVNINNIKSDDSSAGGASEIAEIGSYVFSGITSIGIVLSVVIVAIIGIRYMLGSADERAEYKKSMMPYLIGAALVFGASTIAKAIVGLASL